MRPVTIVCFPELQALDLTGPHEVLVGANRAIEHPRTRRTPLQRKSGRRRTWPNRQRIRIDDVGPRAAPEPATNPSIDTIIVPGGDGARIPQPQLVDWLKLAAPKARRVASVCTGTFILAEAGLCKGRRVTTHWAHAASLAASYPECRVDPDPIFVRDDSLWTSAGVTAGIDLALALVEEDCGPLVAQLVARHLVVYVRRPGSQSQFSSAVWAEPTELEPIRSACELVHQAPGADLSIGTLAKHVGLSSRHFARLFRSAIGEPPAQYVERVRIEAARTVLERETVGLDIVAPRCGFGTAETLRRAFHRRLGISPAAYRRQSSNVAS